LFFPNIWFVFFYYQNNEEDIMLFKKMKKLPFLQQAVLFLVIAFAIITPACSGGGAEGKFEEDKIEVEIERNYVTGEDALSWGVSANASVLTLGLTPGNDTTEINLNWYSDGAPAGKSALVRFIRGTLIAGTELIEKEGAATAAGSAYTQHKAVVTGLKAGSSYQYAVSSDGENWSEAYDFKVPSATGAFKFAVIADPQLHNTTWDNNNRYTPNTTGSKTAKGWLDTMAKIIANGVSFIASGGDQVDTSNNATTAETEYPLFFAPEGLRSLPFAPVSGNHDANVTFNYHYNLPNAQSFADETVETEKDRNYFYLYNNILFVVLNTAPYPTSTSLAQPYVARYKQTIQKAKAANAGKYDWLIVQHHKSTASVADHLADTDIQYYVEAGFEKVMSDEKVDFVLAGHDHVYARSYPLDGRDGGKVSVPDKSANVGGKAPNTYTNPGKPIYLTFTTGSGLKYYAVAPDPTFNYANTLYVKDNAKYPYLGEITEGDGSTQFGSVSYLTKQYLPVSTAAYVQPYIPSYCIAEVDGKTIKFSIYPIVSASGTSPGATAPHSFTEDTAYDWVQVTKN
jgi:3',5'-cyclic AMP phosphodiesterase CpdA